MFRPRRREMLQLDGGWGTRRRSLRVANSFGLLPRDIHGAITATHLDSKRKLGTTR